MQISIISFTKNGLYLSKETAKKTGSGTEVILFTKCRACSAEAENLSVQFVESSVAEWAKEQMQNRRAMLFIGACGIAVRAIAPVLTDKLKDAPVLVMDEAGAYVIPILSGHMGGANEMAVFLAEKTGARPVITTATDIRKKFAVDLFAKKNGLFIVNKKGIAAVSAKALAGEEITLSIETGHGPDGEENCLPEGLKLTAYPPKEFTDIVITSQEAAFEASALLKPREYVLGMGCKKGKCADEIERFISGKISESGISERQIFAISSIVQKKDEPGLVLWSQKRGIPFFTYTAEELQKVQGNFKTSSFVRDTVGVDNVCERAALLACETVHGKKGKIIFEKRAENGMTIAIAKREWEVDFYGQ